MFTVSVGGQPKYSQDFAPLPQGITHIPFNDCAALQQAISDKTCAVIIEPIQGESGVLPATDEFLRTARQLCNQYQAALIFDEVQTGMGRTGKLFAYEHSGVLPDILSSAKALGSGFPIGAMLTTNQFAPSFSVGTHGSTFGGNPLACAVAAAAFDLIQDPQTLNHVQQQGEQLLRGLQAIGTETGVFQAVRGQGLLIGAVLAEAYQGRASEITAAALQQGLMILVAGGNVLRFAPSLLLNDEDLALGLEKLRLAIHTWLAAA